MAKSKKAICKAMYDVLDGVLNRAYLKRPPRKEEWVKANRLERLIKASSVFLDYCSATMEKIDYSAVPHIELDLEDYQEAMRLYRKDIIGFS